MRTLALAIALVITGCGDSDGPDPDEPIPPQDGTFSALSYNVAGLPQGLSGSEPEEYITLISPLLNGYDLVLVQEDFVYHAELSAEANHPHQSEPKTDNVKLVADGLNRFSQFAFDALDRVQWAVCFGDATTGSGDCLAEKGFSMATTTFGDRVTIDVYNFHADAGGGAEDIAAREVGIAQLIDYILEHSAGHALIVGGDTNLHADDPPDQALLTKLKDETGLIDACLHLDCGQDEIDRFFFRPGETVDVVPTSWQLAGEFVTSGGEDLSDHPALHVDFAWKTL